MQLEVLTKLNAARRSRRAAVVVTNLANDQVQVILEGERVSGLLGEETAKAFRSGKAGTVEVEGRSLFLNVHLPPPRIVVIGAVHISQALARLAPVAGYDLTIIDPRTAFATEERFEGVELIADWPEDVLKDHPLDAYTALAAVTHDPKIDDFPLSEALRVGCFYVGALGSRKTHAKRVERLKEMGRTDNEIGRIAAPIGLDIGAASPAEIALATLAQIVQAFRRRDLVTAG
ncbi:XdhC family protein [Neorhizobium galegae]|uniref:XdhC family protein n=1 Tax=Neorhizobium galegae TaxID=399 RepID=UPI000621091E|nr:XdhC family protein [Neorhizobium galegae]CDZ33926.1 Predicted sulfurylase large subunit, molybdopterin cytosine dinucleotide biosynthesis [Neorhizobium galegae bv. officinalis]KAA9387179.1 XdhC family protein [Neorhizobium galegae]KAB1114325.1 XdhC family protein [Neorhizobium galegae]MCM2497434.1 XdhC family protein [Neorhizobium galegae]MCQ1765055.1 XdhC family protein [Neorhizobium galegae]